MPNAETPWSGSNAELLCIPIPIAPEDRGLPLSLLRIKGPSGAIMEARLPIQGEKTIDNALATLRLWKATLITPEDFSI